MEEQIKAKLIEQLDVWCRKYAVGVINETPRYSQVLSNDDFTNWILGSTVAMRGYIIDWTPEELNWLDRMQFKNLLWDWWKRIRTEHLRENYPTISTY